MAFLWKELPDLRSVTSNTAKDRRAGAVGFAEALLIEYNRKSKYCLPMRKLYDDRCSPFVSDDADNDDDFGEVLPENE